MECLGILNLRINVIFKLVDWCYKVLVFFDMFKGKYEIMF